MAVLNKDEFFNRISAQVGTDTSDSSLSFIEDMTDTYNSLVNAAKGDGEDWHKKYDELDLSWKERYRRRFFTGDSAMPDANYGSAPVEETNTDITIDDLFKPSE